MNSFQALNILIMIMNFCLRVNNLPISPSCEKAPPTWENLLKEMIFKTIAPPPLRNDDLYRQLLKAPLYKSLHDCLHPANDTRISQGSVFQLTADRWILCEDDCSNCDECLNRKNPSIKWILKRNKVSESRNILQLNLTPQVNGSFHVQNLGSKTVVYVFNESKKKPSLESSERKRDRKSNTTSFVPKLNINPNQKSSEKKRRTSVDLQDISRSRNATRKESDINLCAKFDLFDSELILGSDHLGRKYLIQILKQKQVADSFLKPEEKDMFFTTILQCVVLSLNENRRKIEHFLTPEEKPTSYRSQRNLYIRMEDLTFVNDTDLMEKIQEKEGGRNDDFNFQNFDINLSSELIKERKLPRLNKPNKAK